MRPLLFPLIATCVWPLPASAVELAFPTTARQTAAQTEALGSVRLPVAGWKDGKVEVIRAEGAVEQQAWQIQVSDLTTLQILAPLREQLLGGGFEVVYECAARACGGFDFRYAMVVLPEPAMHVDLGDFRYILMRRPAEVGSDYVSLLVSRSTGRGFVQVTQVAPTGTASSLRGGGAPAPSTGSAAADGPSVGVVAAAGSLGAELVANGRAVLGDLSFQTGSSQLADGSFSSLEELAGFLAANPDQRIVLVGHTDAEGSLAANVALSRKRALAVMERLAEAHGVAASRMEAEGVGFLAPLTSNATEAGRNINRRVEVILSEAG